MVKNFVTGLITVCLLIQAGIAQVTVLQPGKKQASAVAIIIDKETYEHTKDAVTAYKNMLENKEQLSAYVVINQWQKPDEVKQAILQLKKGKPVLEGVVLVGNIPVPMIRNAQHMTSAFKMDEEKFPMEQSSVASDRFYDDAGLSFRYLKQDAQRPLWHYYELEETSRQVVQSDIYSGRILSHKKGEAGWKEIADFLYKAVKARDNSNELDNLMYFTGNGYNSESLISWQNEYEAVKEMFPKAFASASTNRYLNFRMSSAIKYDLFSELGRPQLDLALFTEHGDIGKQYLSDKHTILTKELEQISPQAKVVIFNACYNGSFHHDENIANGYIFGKGNTIVTHGNTVNVLQDKWTYELLGLLPEGVRMGNWAMLTNTLESHLIGDPTYRFSSTSKINEDVVSMKNNNGFWKKLSSQNASPVITALALKMRFRNGDPDLAKNLVQIYKTAAAMVVRMECVNLLFRMQNQQLEEIIPLALHDNYELIRRKTAEWLSNDGQDAFAQPLANLLFERPNDERVIMSMERSFATMDIEAVRFSITAAADKHPYFYEKDQQVSNFIKKIEHQQKNGFENLAQAKNFSLPISKRIQAIRFFRNYNYHFMVPDFLTMAGNASENAEIRQNVLEMLGWFSLSYQKETIIKACENIAADEKNPANVRGEAEQTILRLTNWTLI